MNLRIVAILVANLLTISSTSFALQPLAEFLAASRKNNFDQREAQATFDQRDAEAQSNGRKLLPVLSARGVYTRNQYEAISPSPAGNRIITPNDQLDAFFSVDVPIVDLAAWARMGAGNVAADAAQARVRATTLDTELAVTRAYYQLLASRALIVSAKQAFESVAANQSVVEQRKSAGLASDLDFMRATAEVERTKQVLANAEYIASSQARALATLAGLEPTEGSDSAQDDLHPEPALDSFLRHGDDETPSLAASRLEAKAQDKLASAQWVGLLPSLSANATERFTNATGFANKSAFYTVSATLSWRLDPSTTSNAKAQDAAAQVSEVRRQRAVRAQSDAVKDAWALVKSQLASCRAARAESQASRLALQMAQDRYKAGTALQLDVLTAIRSAFQADAVRLQSDADLAVARTQLRIVAGKGAKP